MFDANTKDCYREITPTGGFTWQRGDTMSRLDMVLSSSGKATMCTNTMVDWNLIDSDHARVRIWLDICKKEPREPGLFKVNRSLLEDPDKLLWANENINIMMQTARQHMEPLTPTGILQSLCKIHSFTIRSNKKLHRSTRTNPTGNNSYKLIQLQRTINLKQHNNHSTHNSEY
jgi:hypothetical protein